MHSQSRLTCAGLKILPVTHPYTESKTHGYSPRLFCFRHACFQREAKIRQTLIQLCKKKVHFQSDRRLHVITFSQKKTVCFKLFPHHSYRRLLLPVLRNRKALLQKKPRTRSKRKLPFANDSFDIAIFTFEMRTCVQELLCYE